MAERVGIIGAGLAGLSCAYYLEKQGYTPLLFERASTPGGRVSTEHYEGYLLDKGLQILLTSYKEVSDIVRFYELGLGRFHSGVDVYYQGSWHPFYNPLKHPLSVFKNRKIPFVTFSDTVKLGSLYFKNVLKSQVPVFQVGRPTLRAFLAENEISPAFVEAVIRPFFGGVSLDPDIQISDELFLWLLHFFIEGVGVLPKAGMQALPKLLQVS
jgi:predicted NAD/FAD-binding protein